MFPLKANDPYIKETGERSTLGSIVGGGGSDTPKLPDYGIADAGKVLTVGDDGSLEWDEKGTGGGIYTTGVIRPTLYGPSNNTKFKIGSLPNPPSKGANLTSGYYGDTSYDITNLIDFSIGNFIEIQSYMTENLLTALGAVQLAALTTADTSVELSHPITDYDVIMLGGVYDSSGGTSQYDTTILQINTELDTPYWFGVKDRNDSYSSTITFTDSTHGTLAASRRIKIYGFNL